MKHYTIETKLFWFSLLLTCLVACHGKHPSSIKAELPTLQSFECQEDAKRKQVPGKCTAKFDNHEFTLTYHRLGDHHENAPQILLFGPHEVQSYPSNYLNRLLTPDGKLLDFPVRVLGVDPIQHVKQGDADPQNLSLDMVMVALRELVNKNFPNGPVVVGGFMRGSLWAMYYNAFAPDRVKKLFTVNAHPFGYPETGHFLSYLFTLESEPGRFLEKTQEQQCKWYETLYEPMVDIMTSPGFLEDGKTPWDGKGSILAYTFRQRHGFLQAHVVYQCHKLPSNPKGKDPLWLRRELELLEEARLRYADKLVDRLAREVFVSYNPRDQIARSEEMRRFVNLLAASGHIVDRVVVPSEAGHYSGVVPFLKEDVLGALIVFLGYGQDAADGGESN